MTDNPYQKKQFIEKLSQTCSLFKAIKNNQPYFMYQYSQMNQCDQYNFKILKKLIACTRVLGLVDKYEYNGNTYFITDYVESNLLKQQLKQTYQVFDQVKALEYFAKIVQLIEELHGNGIIYRNFRLEAIGFQKKELYLTDFRLSQIVRRRERYFDVVGVPQYLAPEFFLEDGCGYQVDVWAAGVCLYFMLTACYPFKTQNLTQDQILQQIQKKCKKGFDFQTLFQQSKKSKHIQPTPHICDLFKRIFTLDYSQRITPNQIKQHPAMKPFFDPPQTKEDQEIMSVIQQESLSVKESYFVSMFKEYPCHYDFHKEEVVLDFLEHCSEIIMLNSSEYISEKVRYGVSFSVLKVAMMKANNLIDVLYGKREPQFKVPSQEWQSMRKKASFGKIRQKIQKKKKILEMLFRSACLNVQSLRQSSKFYTQQIPEDFATIKPEYRNMISKMFDLQMEMMRKKESREAMRKHCQNLVRLTILGLINRIFQEPGIHQNFQLYFKWAGKESLEDLEEWIENQKMNNLKIFVKTITAKYMKGPGHENKE